MTLQEFLAESKMSAAEMARQAKMTRGGISRLLKGTRAPSVASATRIHGVTDGKVGLLDWPKYTRKNPRKHVRETRRKK